MFELSSILLFLVFALTLEYEFKCPVSGEWRLRVVGFNCSIISQYVCLFRYPERAYHETCDGLDYSSTGSKLIYEPFFNKAYCSYDRYQPFPFSTDGSSKCLYQKTFCSEKGQYVFQKGSIRSDISCGCDLTRGYEFVSMPKHECYCIPSEEDCSCHKIPCNDLVDQCPKDADEITTRSMSTTLEKNRFSDAINIFDHDNTGKHYRFQCLYIILVLSAVMIIVVILFYILSKQLQVTLLKDRYAPRKVEIVECTDCSITIEWDMNEPDDCLEYELGLRCQGTDEENVTRFNAKEFSAVKNGHFSYIKTDVLPETYYELKMCSVNNNLKSRYAESKTIQTLKRAPRGFDIVECTDSSITMKWYINDTDDDLLEYGLYHKVHGTDCSTVEIISAQNVLAGEDGRHIFTWTNLLPETCYELKLCFVNNNVKSHYTESKTKWTLQRVLPEAITKLQEKDKIRINNLMQSSEMENRYFVKIMIVGKESTGKTCLLRRLMKENISDVFSTDGIDMVVRRCKINIDNGEWTIGRDIDDDKVGRIKRALIPIERTKNNIGNSRDMDLTKSRKMQKSDNNARDNMPQVENKISPEINEDSTMEEIKTHRDELSTNVTLEENKKNDESSLLVLPSNMMSNVFSTLDQYASCQLWDFAGQKEFYATHQAFLTSTAVYIVVADMNDDLVQHESRQHFADFRNVGEYVDFWFDSIHCHRTVDDPVRKHFDPPILLVFTGKDRCKKAYIEKRKEELDKQIYQVLGHQRKHQHLHEKFYVSNTEDPDAEFKGLRKAIFDAARKMDHWGQAYPLKWILLEHLLEINKGNGKHFITFTVMVSMAKHPDINELKNEELMKFLRFQHNVGSIIFYEDIPDLIILNPQWLADAFRCLVTDRIDNRLHHLEDWVLLKRHGKISESLITKLFESKPGSQFSEQQENLPKIMEKLDILVKLGNSGFYLMPSKMPSSTFDEVCQNVGIHNNCKRTSWLCLKFDFLPPSFFNHISAWFIRNYRPTIVERDRESFALYRGICVFDIDSSDGVKILVTMSTDIIALQVVTLNQEQKESGNRCSKIYNEVKQEVEKIKQRYKLKLSIELRFKCSDGDYHKDTLSYETLKRNQEYYCNQHNAQHVSEKIYSPWMKNEVTMIQNDRTEMNTTQDDCYTNFGTNAEL